MEHELIYYVHDGSETVSDSFTVGANDTGLRKHSVGQTVYVQLTAVNDEPPVVTANRVLRVSLRHRGGPLWLLSEDSGVGRVASCHGWLDDGNYACYVEEGPGGWQRGAGIHLEGSQI